MSARPIHRFVDQCFEVGGIDACGQVLHVPYLPRQAGRYYEHADRAGTYRPGCLLWSLCGRPRDWACHLVHDRFIDRSSAENHRFCFPSRGFQTLEYDRMVLQT